MSKYARTKDKIFEITDKQYDILCNNLNKEEKENYKNITSFGIGSIEDGTYKSILIKDIIKPSDSIKDLVDEFIWDKSIIRFIDKTHFSYENDDFVFELDGSKLKTGIYGAIWIVDDNGAPILKSVSRMNEKGELELI